jgi:AcrR family transcriptional regulator
MPKVIDDRNVFRAVIDVLSTCGYESATTKNIAGAAGIHEATLFRKYGNKFNLIEQAIKTQFLDVPLAKVVYTGDLQADLLSIIKAYLKTSEIVGNILQILLIETPRNPELERLLQLPWKNITRVTNILEQYQAQHILKEEPVLHSVNFLLGPIMVEHLIKQADINLPIPPVEPQVYVEFFLNGHLLSRT